MGVGPALPRVVAGSGLEPSPTPPAMGITFRSAHAAASPASSAHLLFVIRFRHVRGEQIQQCADKAQAGYDVEEMKRRGRGRPGRGAERMQVVAVRLTTDELTAVDAIAEREHISRSEAIRRALADFAAWAADEDAQRSLLFRCPR